MNWRIKGAATVALLALGACTSVGTGPITNAAALHRDLLVLDTHLDTPINFGRQSWDFAAANSYATDVAQVDLGRMKGGNLDGGFFVIFTAQGPLTPQGYAEALTFARKRSALIDAEVAKHPQLIAPATSAAQAEALHSEGTLVAFKAIENSYPLGEDLSLLAEFHAAGVRMAGPVHTRNNQFADSSEDTPLWGGLSPLGKRWVAEMNRLGMVIDASHSSDATFDQLLALSKTPLILSHTSPKWAHDHPRNLDDDRIRALAAKGGAICASTIYLSDIRLDGGRGELFAAYERIAEMTPQEQADLARRTRALDKVAPLWDADFERYMEALLHIIEVAGVEHVCFGADWDGGGGLRGLEDITDLPRITERLLKAGYSRANIAKMTSGNVLRIMRAAEAAAAR